MLTRPFAILVALLIGSGCAGSYAPSSKSIPPNSFDQVPTAALPNEPIQLVFFDSRTFDFDLSNAMRAGSPEISIDVPAAFTLNKIPERVDRWLYSVKESGGAVVATPEFQTRGLFAVVIDVLVSVFVKLDEKLTFAPSDRYRATLLYRADGTVSKIVFNRRSPEPTVKS